MTAVHLLTVKMKNSNIKGLLCLLKTPKSNPRTRNYSSKTCSTTDACKHIKSKGLIVRTEWFCVPQCTSVFRVQKTLSSQGTASDDRSKWSEKPHQFQMTGAMSQTSGCSWTLAVHISMNWLCGQGLTPENWVGK